MRNQAVTYARGVSYLLLAGVFLSTTGVFVRLIESASPWQILFYRSIAFSLMCLVFLFFTTTGTIASRYRHFNWTDLIVTCSLGVGFILYLLSVYYTTVANTVLLLSTGPLFAALLGWMVLRESISRVTWFAMCLVLSGVFIMFGGDLSGSHLHGMLFALGAVMSFAVMVVALRSGADDDQDKLPATALAGFLAAALCIPFIDSYSISTWDLIMALGLGTVQVGVGFILITLGARGVPAAQVPLLTLGETALAPLWVWLLVTEVPATATVIGGAIVLFAVVTQGLVGVKGARSIA